MLKGAIKIETYILRKTLEIHMDGKAERILGASTGVRASETPTWRW